MDFILSEVELSNIPWDYIKTFCEAPGASVRSSSGLIKCSMALFVKVVGKIEVASSVEAFEDDIVSFKSWKVVDCDRSDDNAWAT